MPRSAPSWTALVAGLVVACGAGGPDGPAPPVPDNLSEFDPRVVARIRAALAQVEAEPRRAQAWAELGLIYVSERLKSQALECFRVAARIEPRQPRWPYREAITLAQVGELPEAIVAMQHALELEPSYPPSHARMGSYRLALGDLDGAERDYRAATVLDSSYPGGWVGLARVALQRDRTAEAIEILQRLCKEDPEDKTFRQLLASAERTGGGAGLPAENFLADKEIPVWNDPWELEARAFREKPAMLQIGRLLESGKEEEALALLEEQRAQGTDDVATLLKTAGVLQRMGRKAEAVEAVDDALALEPENSTALLMKAQFLADGGEKPAAVALLERVTALQPTFGGAFAAKGRMLFELDQHEAAAAAIQRALELGEGDYELRYSLACSSIVLKRWREAADLFTALVAERAEHGDAWLGLALARVRTGALAEAEQALARGQSTGKCSERMLAEVSDALEQRKAKKARRDGAR